MSCAEVAARLAETGAAGDLPDGVQLADNARARLGAHEDRCRALLQQGQVRFPVATISHFCFSRCFDHACATHLNCYHMLLLQSQVPRFPFYKRLNATSCTSPVQKVEGGLKPCQSLCSPLLRGFWCFGEMICHLPRASGCITYSVDVLMCDGDVSIIARMDAVLLLCRL